MEKFDPAGMEAYVALYEITWAAFADLAGVPLATIRAIRYQGVEPVEEVRQRLDAALDLPAPASKLRHADYVRLWWGRVDRGTIATALGVSPQRVSSIAKRAGLPPLKELNTGKDEDHGKGKRAAEERRDHDAAAG